MSSNNGTQTKLTVCKMKCPDTSRSINCEYYGKDDILLQSSKFDNSSLALANFTNAGGKETGCNNIRTYIQDCFNNGFENGIDTYECFSTNQNFGNSSTPNIITKCYQKISQNGTNFEENICNNDHTFNAIFFQEHLGFDFTPLFIAGGVLLGLGLVIGGVLFTRRRQNKWMILFN